MVTCNVGMVTDGGRVPLNMLLVLSQKVLADFHMYSSLHFNMSHLYLYFTPLFYVMLFLFLRVTRRFLMVLSPLKIDLDFHFIRNLLKLLLRPFLWLPLYGYLYGCWCVCGLVFMVAFDFDPSKDPIEKLTPL